MSGENGRRRRGAARRQGSDLQLSAWQERAALKTLSLRAPCSEGLTTPGLSGGAPQCNCSGGNSASVSSAWGVQGHRPDHRYTHPPPTPPGHPVCTSAHTDCTCRRPGAAHTPPLCGCMLTSEKTVPTGVLNPKDLNNPGLVAAAHKGDSDRPTPPRPGDPETQVCGREGPAQASMPVRRGKAKRDTSNATPQTQSEGDNALNPVEAAYPIQGRGKGRTAKHCLRDTDNHGTE